ncbi:MAG: hypothetical protein H6834_08305 [Planctomycetes bacterium]|nr:hypothetical protein [Planctomycetota bacterium]
MLDLQIRAFLCTNPAIQTIGFSLPGVAPVTARGFHLLASCFMTNAEALGPRQAVARRRIEVRTRPELVSRSAVAEYLAFEERRNGHLVVASDTMLLHGPHVFSHQVDAAILFHECVHALQDASGPRRVRAIDDEAAAHLAEAWFHLEHGNDAATPPRGTNADQAALYSMLTPIFPIAQAARARWRQGQRPAPVTTAERDALRQIMIGFGVGRLATYRNDGIRRGGRSHRIVSGAWN